MAAECPTYAWYSGGGGPLVDISHTLMTLSSPPVRRYSPFGDTVAAPTLALWTPCTCLTTRPVSQSQRSTRQSDVVPTSCVPSGENSSWRTHSSSRFTGGALPARALARTRTPATAPPSPPSLGPLRVVLP